MTRGGVAERDDHACLSQLRRPPVSGGGVGHAVWLYFPLPAQSACGRGDAGCTRHHREPRERAAMGLKFGQAFANRIRQGDCPAPETNGTSMRSPSKSPAKKHWLWRAVRPDRDGARRTSEPPRASAVPSPTADTAPSQRDEHIRMIRDKGRLGSAKDDRLRQALARETAVFRYRTIVGASPPRPELPQKPRPGSPARCSTG